MNDRVMCPFCLRSPASAVWTCIGCGKCYEDDDDSAWEPVSGNRTAFKCVVCEDTRAIPPCQHNWIPRVVSA